VLGGNQYFVDGGGGNRQMLGNAGSGNFVIYAGSTVVTGPAQDTSWHIFALTFNGASSKLRVGGGAGVTGNAGPNSLESCILGTYGGLLAGTYNLNGQIAEGCVTAALLTLAEINQWGTHLSTKTGLSWTPAT